MYAHMRAQSLQRSIALGRRSTYLQRHVRKPLTPKQRVATELRKLGVTSLALLRLEARHLYKILHDGEHIKGVVHGRAAEGYAMLVATERRVIFFDKKPLFTNEDEITYDVVSGVKVATNGIMQTVTLHTRIKDYVITTFNRQCAYGFMAWIEARRLERMKGEFI